MPLRAPPLDRPTPPPQASRVDLKKLEKAEAKIKAKLEKRNRKDLYEGSKLMDIQAKKVRRLPPLNVGAARWLARPLLTTVLIPCDPSCVLRAL